MMARLPRADGGAAARNRLLPEGRIAGPMPWVIAIMMFLTILACAAGLALNRAANSLGEDLRGRVTVQLVEANADVRRSAVAALTSALRAMPSVRAIHPVEEATLAQQLRPWLGEDMAATDLPIPALIDVELTRAGAADLTDLRHRLSAISSRARVEPHATFLGPLSSLMTSLAWLAALVVVLMMLATGAVVILAARGAHDGHRVTIDILHLMGATDVQIARLFQRRIALDALFGALLGFVCATPVILLIGSRLTATGSELMQSVSLPLPAWAVLLLIPVAVVGLAMLTARYTVVRALARQL